MVIKCIDCQLKTFLSPVFSRNAHNQLIRSSARLYSDDNKHLAKYQSLKTLNVTEAAKYVINIELNRPKVRNAMNMDMFGEIKHVFTLLNEDPHYRVVILSANGGMFSAGIDLSTFAGSFNMHTEDVARRALIIRNLVIGLQDSFAPVTNCQKPIISVVDGYCIGAGVDLISATDIRYCSRNSYFQVKEVDLGLAADMGTLQLLPRIVGNSSFIREVTFTGRKIEADEAERVGLVGKVLDSPEAALSAARETAQLIAKKSPIAVQGSKVCLDYSRDHTIQEGLVFMANWNMSMLQSEDVQKSAMALMTKSKESPHFEDL